MTAHINVSEGGKNKWVDVGLGFVKFCEYDDSKLKLSRVALETDSVSVFYTCPECHATIQELYQLVAKRIV